MKRILCLLLAAMLFVPLTACTSKPPVDAAAESAEPTAPAETVEIIEYETARIERGYANISLAVPVGWEYRLEDDVPDFGTAQFAICIRPEGESKGWVKVAYFDSFGICGTGTISALLELGKYKANSITYVNAPAWEFIFLHDTPGEYVAINSDANSWLVQHRQDVLDILSTLTVGEGVITMSEAAKIAEEHSGNYVLSGGPRFDYESGVWTVDYTVDGQDYIALQIRIDHEGNFLGADAMYDSDDEVIADDQNN